MTEFEKEVLAYLRRKNRFSFLHDILDIVFVVLAIVWIRLALIAVG